MDSYTPGADTATTVMETVNNSPGAATETTAMETVLVIESSIAGRVIGQHGKKIKSIMEKTGATIWLIDNHTEKTKLVTVNGNEDVRQAATDIVRKVVGRKLLRIETRPRPRRDDSPSYVNKLSDEAWEEIIRDSEEKQRAQMERRPPILKDFYVLHEEVEVLSIEDVNAFRAASNSTTVNYVQGADESRPIPKPIKTFEHAFHRYPDIMAVIDKHKFTSPTYVQCQAWPIILSGHDLIAIAQARTGKTLAYMLPALVHLQRQPTPLKERKGPTVVIVGPSKELVIQIEGEVKKYIFGEICVMSVYGATCLDNQVKRLLMEKPDIIVATPRRLNELISIKAVDTENVSYLVLDKADCMLDTSLKVLVELATKNLRLDKQTILTSATWTKNVQRLADCITKNAMHINVSSFDLTTMKSIEQNIVVLGRQKKESWCLNFLKIHLSKDDKVIIFMRTKRSVDRLYAELKNQNINCK